MKAEAEAKVAPRRRAPGLRSGARPERTRRHRSTDGERARHRPREEKGGQRRSGIVIEVNGRLPDVTRVSASSGGREKQHPFGARRRSHGRLDLCAAVPTLEPGFIKPTGPVKPPPSGSGLPDRFD